MNPQTKYHTWYFVAAMFGILLLQQVWAQYQTVEHIAYSEFLGDLKAGKVVEVEVEGNYIAGTLKEPLPSGRTQFITTRVPAELVQELDKYGVKFGAVVQSTWLSSLLGWIVPTLLFLGIWMFVFRRFANKQGFGGLMQIGKSKAKIYVETDTKVTFDDVAGVDEAKDELKEVVEFLKQPEKYARLGARMPRGVLLVGPPRTAQTLRAR